ncbi:MAG TPA: hypothetical protein PK640_06920 [Verrucomicrobiota bacterium]|nr:hypothetical protein [Verrucomicrobiota bacterium]
MPRKQIECAFLLMLVLTGAAPVRLHGSPADDPPSRLGADTPKTSTRSTAIPAPFPGQPAFKHRGFYFHCGWAFDHPFAPHSWSREDFCNAFDLLRHMGFDTVMYWPQIEGIPAPISADDAAVLENVRGIIADARAAGLRCWFTLTPNLTSPSEIARQPFAERNPFRTYQPVRLDIAEHREPFLDHRRAMLRVVNNADAYVTIDGDPGGYPGAKPEDFLRVFASDRAALDQYGTDPKRQLVVPWIWAGWGRTQPLWQGDLTPFSKATMTFLKQHLPEPWLMLSGRSHEHDFANGRINLALAEELGLVERSMILCYEAIEFEPTPPAAVLQFGAIRRILREELRLAPKAAGVMGNAQQPIMVLPNIYFFARASWNPAYLDRSDDEVLHDFAAFLGGPADLLIPAWQCLTLPLDRLPRDLADGLRRARLTSDAARCVPGGPQRYLDILAAQVASRIGLLTAVDGAAGNDDECTRRVADGTAALVNWWQVHHYVMDGDRNQGFAWRFVRGDQVALLQAWAKRNATDTVAVSKGAAELLAARKVLRAPEAFAVTESLFR